MTDKRAAADPLVNKKRIGAYDIFAGAAFVCIVCGFLYMVRTGMGVPDESFYVTIPHRLLQGDRLIIDDWHVSQFSSFMQYLPVKLYYEYHGSLDGVILFLRYLYVVFQALTLAVIYPFFRKYEWKGAAAWTVFGMYVPVMVYTLNYYTLCLWPAAVVCTVLCFADRLNAPVCILLGILTALAVLAEPLIAFAFFLYTLLVWIKAAAAKKKRLFAGSERFVDMRCWAFITLGVFLCAGAFLPFLFRGSDPLTTLRAIPNLFNGVEYDFSFGGNIQTMKVVNRALELYGVFPAVLLAVLTAESVCLQKYRKTVRPFIAAGLVVCFVYAFIHAAFIALKMNHCDYYLLFYGLPLYLCGPAAYFMLEKRDGRLWTFWCAGAVLSVLLDISSAVILGVCGALSAAASLVFLFDLAGDCVKELGAIKKESEEPQLFRKMSVVVSLTAVILCLAAVIGNEAVFDVYRSELNIIESCHSRDFTNGVCDKLLESGAYAGIRTTSTVAAKYNAMHDDLAAVRDTSDGPVLIFDRFPYLYLTLDKPYATFSAWYVDWQENDRLLLYYREHPDKLPAIVYVPKYDPYNYRVDKEAEKKLDWLRSVWNCTVSEGKAGYVVSVKGTAG